MNKKLKFTKIKWNMSCQVDMIFEYTRVTLETGQSLLIPMWSYGDLTLQLSLEAMEKGLHRTQWVWRNNRSNPKYLVNGIKTTFYLCLGVWKCTRSGCECTLRPISKKRGLLNQIYLTLTAYFWVEIRCSVCQTKIMHMACSARQIVSTSISPMNGVQYRHEGFDLTV